MRDCLIFGSGRSGTSMLAGTLHHSGYFAGDRLHAPRDSNPKGFFEWYQINRINEEILEPYDRPTGADRLIHALWKRHTVTNPGRNQRWMAALPATVEILSAAPRIEAEIRHAAQRRPFCYKDPRFSYTLPVWRRCLPSATVYLCLFREPGETVASILKECRSQPYLASLLISRRSALKAWFCLYTHALRHHRNGVPIMFTHYEQILDGSALPALAERLQVRLEPGFADPALRRSVGRGRLPIGVAALYRELCSLAGFPCRA